MQTARRPSDCGLSSPHLDLDPIAKAGRDIWNARSAAEQQRLQEAEPRSLLAAVDAMVGILEERNLTGHREVDRPLRKRLRRLEEQVGLPLPRAAQRARSTSRLHAVLLDWHESVLDRLVPKRLESLGPHDGGDTDD